MTVLDMRPATVFSGTAIAPRELLELAEFATPRHELSDEQLAYEAENLADWCDDDPSLAQHAVLLARGTGVRAEVVAVLQEVARRPTPPSRLAVSA